MGAGMGCSICAEVADDITAVEGRKQNEKPGLVEEDQVVKSPFFEMDARDRRSPATASTGMPENIQPSDSQDDWEPDEVDFDFDKGEEAMAAFEAALGGVITLLRQAKVFDAMSALKNLEHDVQSRSPAKRLNDGITLGTFLDKFRQDAFVLKLREVGERMMKVLAIITPRALPGGANDKRWVTVHLADEKIHSDFKGDISIRFAEGAERDPHGSSTQIICCGYLSNFPLDLEKIISVYRETDLYRKEWVADCERCEGEASGPEMLYGSKSRFINSSPLLPVRLDIITVRDFAVCSKSPVPGRGPGVLVMDMSPPSSAKTFHGWDIPDTYRKSVRVNGVEMFLYFTPSAGKPGFSDIFAFAKAGAPVPQFLVPLSVLKRFFANHFMTLFSLMRKNVVDGWDSLEYKDRIGSIPEFYQSITALREENSSPPPTSVPEQ